MQGIHIHIMERGDKGGEVEKMKVENGSQSELLVPYEFIARFFPSEFISSLKEDSDLHRLLVDDNPKHDIWRKELNDCLELAYRYDLVNADLESRLKKGDRESWQATMNELRVAKILEGLFGVGCLLWRPKGRGKKVGEFQLIKTYEPIFIEVKTIFPRDLEKLEQRIIDKLMRYAEQVSIPIFLNVIIENVGSTESFSGIKFKDYLKSELPKLGSTELEKESIKLPDYHDKKTGLYLKIETLAIKPKKEEKNCHIGIIGGGVKTIVNEQYIKHSLSKAYTQLPTTGQPCLIIICPSTAFPLDEDDMLNALLGNLAVRYYFSNVKMAKKPETFRKPDGFFQIRRNRRVSAVGLYKGRNIEKPLEIYHNPVGANPIPDSTFMDMKEGVRQLVKANNQEMKWIN